MASVVVSIQMRKTFAEAESSQTRDMLIRMFVKGKALGNC
jgi:hypothetical protein